MAVALLTFLALIIRGIVYDAVNHYDVFTMNSLNGLLEAFILAVTIVVVAVPEGLPLAVTISLAYSVSQMYHENNLVRKLHASETMGGANEICTDKTGTLTQNKMTVMAMYDRGQVKLTSGDGDDKVDDLLAESVLYNCSAHVEQEDPTKVDSPLVAKGNVTECGMINYLMKSNYNVQECLNKRESEQLVEFMIPFNSSRKRATSAIRNPRLGKGQVSVFCKGAPEMVIELCDSVIGRNGEEDDLDQEKKNEILSTVVKQFAAKSYRTILVAHSAYSEKEWAKMKTENNNWETEEDRETVECGLTLIGIFGLQDPLRKGIPEAVEQCHKSGVNVRMVTGDNIDTAIAISKEAKILDGKSDNEKGYTCMVGKQFHEAIGGLVTTVDDDGKKQDSVANQEVFDKITAELKVLARSSPEDKYLLVTGLRAQGKVVAVTGDGTNDAPALSKADVGFAMGVSGSDVAKAASDIVLTDDNFCSVLTAIKYGRNVYDNVRKFLQFQLTVNIVALFIVFAGSVIFADPPLTSVQMLWVNLIMDTFAALALATEPPSDLLLDRKPHARDESIVSKTMWRNIIGQSVYQIGWLLVILFAGKELFNLPYPADTKFYNGKEDNAGQQDSMNKTINYTILFQAFVFMQIFNQINSRKLGNELNVFEGFFNNWLFLAIMAFTIVV